jgi:hypothetical protein
MRYTVKITCKTKLAVRLLRGCIFASYVIGKPAASWLAGKIVKHAIGFSYSARVVDDA